MRGKKELRELRGSESNSGPPVPARTSPTSHYASTSFVIENGLQANYAVYAKRFVKKRQKSLHGRSSPVIAGKYDYAKLGHVDLPERAVFHVEVDGEVDVVAGLSFS